jgi:extracellular factor (EF) 3-hydroxypalmitic acid methyl ester biosynthesis protein
MIMTMKQFTKKAFGLMDEIEQALRDGNIDEGMTNLVLGLYQLQKTADINDWEIFSQRDFLSHSIVSLIHQDPFTKHSFDKPRNYAGDADLIDYMYGCRQLPRETTELGKRIFEWAGKQSTTQSVRARRQIIASMIDELGGNSDNLRILSIACGHLREALSSQAVKEKKVSQYFAFDQDARSLEVVKNELSQFNIQPIQASIKSLFTNGKQFHDLDFVYAAGLFDYLSQKVAVKLTGKMFQMLKPKGKLLVANFAPCLLDQAYGETFMQWKLNYRNEAEVSNFASLIPANEIGSQRLFWDEPHNVIYLELIKK